MPGLGSILKKWALVGGGGMAALAGGVAVGGALPPPQNVNPDTVLSYYMGARYAAQGGAAGGAVGGFAGAFYGSRTGMGAKGTLLSSLIGAGIGGIIGAATAPDVGAGAMVANTMGMTDQAMSAGTYSALGKMAALRADIARLHRPIRGMGY
jgi:hypothetical protein